jgi:glycosyltransferase involved in cell wall biosynthesis
MLTFSIILPAYLRPEVLAETLERLARQTIGSRTLEVLLIDDGPSPENETLAAHYANTFHSLRYLPQNNKGQSKARNHAVSLAQAPFLFFMGDDILLEPDVLEKHRAFHEKCPHKNIAVFGKIEIDPRLKDDPFVQWLNNGGPQNTFFRLREGYVGPDLIESAHLSVRREFALKVKFDERLRYFENYVWAQALFQTGFLFYYLPSAVSYHYHPVTLAQYGGRMYGMGRTVALLANEGGPLFVEMAKHQRPARWFSLVRYLIAGRFLRSRKYLHKYWRMILNDRQYRGFLDGSRGEKKGI